MNLVYMWYLGYDFDEETPNHSVISKARARYGKEVFEEFFNKPLSLCVEAGLVRCEKIYIDSTLIEANASVKSIVSKSNALGVKHYEENRQPIGNITQNIKCKLQNLLQTFIEKFKILIDFDFYNTSATASHFTLL